MAHDKEQPSPSPVPPSSHPSPDSTTPFPQVAGAVVVKGAADVAVGVTAGSTAPLPAQAEEQSLPTNPGEQMQWGCVLQTPEQDEPPTLTGG